MLTCASETAHTVWLLQMRFVLKGTGALCGRDVSVFVAALDKNGELEGSGGAEEEPEWDHAFSDTKGRERTRKN